ncbi:MAG: hypothetical protein MZV64_59355 [Ignavibacteriales bacterium]|nr:hypothetical protein [Ignavibacteriales bacterium]
MSLSPPPTARSCHRDFYRHPSHSHSPTRIHTGTDRDRPRRCEPDRAFIRE